MPADEIPAGSAEEMPADRNRQRQMPAENGRLGQMSTDAGR